MEVASLSPLPVGVLAWNSPDPCVTVIVKATFDVEADGTVSLVPDQPPISLDRVAADDDAAGPTSDEDALFYPSDFAPRKSGVDVLVVGHVRTPHPTRQLPFDLSVGPLSISLVAVTRTPVTIAPLSAWHVRRVPTDPTTAVRLGPASSSVPGWVSRTVPPGFDFQRFNSAPVEHRIPSLPPDTTIRTRGLLRRGDRRIRLAGVSPRVFHVEDRGATHPGDAVAMVCDTLWLDTDREHVTLVWRGQVPRSLPGERPFLVVKLHGAGDVTWRDMSRGLSRAAWINATEAHDLKRSSLADLPPSSATLPTSSVDEPESTTARLAKKLRWAGETAPPPLTERTGPTEPVPADEMETLADSAPPAPPSAPIPLK